jgi:hypothetical protein
LTAQLAYTARPDLGSHFLADGQSAREELAVSWALVRLAHRTPGSVEDQVALENARVHILELASALGLDEEDLRDVLRGRAEALGIDPFVRGGASTRHDTSA